MHRLTDKEILDIAMMHCEFTPEGTYHLRKYSSAWAIVQIVREAMEKIERIENAQRQTRMFV